MKKKRPAGRPKVVHPIPPELARKMVRRMPFLFIPMIFGKRVAAEEWMRRCKEHCEETGRKYVRKDALERAAKAVHMDQTELDNWLRRSKRDRVPC